MRGRGGGWGWKKEEFPAEGMEVGEAQPSMRSWKLFYVTQTWGWRAGGWGVELRSGLVLSS